MAFDIMDLSPITLLILAAASIVLSFYCYKLLKEHTKTILLILLFFAGLAFVTVKWVIPSFT